MVGRLLGVVFASALVCGGPAGAQSVMPGKVAITPQLRAEIEDAIRRARLPCPGLVALYDNGAEAWCGREPYKISNPVFRYRVARDTAGVSITRLAAPR